MTVAGIRVPAEEAFQFGVIEKEDDGGRIVHFHEKNPDAPRLADAPHQVLASMGNYIFDAEVFREIMTEDADDNDLEARRRRRHHPEAGRTGPSPRVRLHDQRRAG